MSGTGKSSLKSVTKSLTGANKTKEIVWNNLMRSDSNQNTDLPITMNELVRLHEEYPKKPGSYRPKINWTTGNPDRDKDGHLVAESIFGLSATASIDPNQKEDMWVTRAEKADTVATAYNPAEEERIDPETGQHMVDPETGRQFGNVPHVARPKSTISRAEQLIIYYKGLLENEGINVFSKSIERLEPGKKETIINEILKDLKEQILEEMPSDRSNVINNMINSLEESMMSEEEDEEEDLGGAKKNRKTKSKRKANRKTKSKRNTKKNTKKKAKGNTKKRR